MSDVRPGTGRGDGAGQGRGRTVTAAVTLAGAQPQRHRPVEVVLSYVSGSVEAVVGLGRGREGGIPVQLQLVHVLVGAVHLVTVHLSVRVLEEI